MSTPDPRVLIVDDSAVARQVISRAIEEAGGMQVAGLARDGQMGLEQLAQVRPDAVVLDLEMPTMDGITFLHHLRTTDKHLPVVVFSTATGHGAAATLEALSAGATAYALKPSALRGTASGDVQSELIPVLRAVLGRPAPRTSTGRVRRAGTGRIEAVVIAVSTGGPAALNTVLPELPGELPVPVLLVQHMPSTFTALLAQRLDARCRLQVVEAADGQTITAGTIYVAPGGRHLTVGGVPGAPSRAPHRRPTGQLLPTVRRPPLRHRRTPFPGTRPRRRADRDGRRRAAGLRTGGGTRWQRDRPGPGHRGGGQHAGRGDRRRAGLRHPAGGRDRGGDHSACRRGVDFLSVSPEDYAYVQDLLRQRIANTLDADKEYLVRTRLTPLAEHLGHDSISTLLSAARSGHRILQDHVVEAMTINETSFFRDTHPFRALTEHIVPDLLRSGPRSLRMWSAATASGQEAYSLAILMAETFPTAPEPSILGTDVAESVLRKARAGAYTQLEVNRGLPARSLVRHFQQQGRTWHVTPQIKKVVRFQRLNLIEPWPFLPPMDVIMLRNVLIYFDDRTRCRGSCAGCGRAAPGWLSVARQFGNVDAAIRRRRAPDVRQHHLLPGA